MSGWWFFWCVQCEKQTRIRNSFGKEEKNRKKTLFLFVFHQNRFVVQFIIHVNEYLIFSVMYSNINSMCAPRARYSAYVKGNDTTIRQKARKNINKGSRIRLDAFYLIYFFCSALGVFCLSFFFISLLKCMRFTVSRNKQINIYFVVAFCVTFLLFLLLFLLFIENAPLAFRILILHVISFRVIIIFI